MLKIRVIPTLLWKDLGLVKGVGFDSWRRVGPVLPAIKVYNARQVDELILLDITATLGQKEPDFDAISEFAASCFVPLTVGGGIKTLAHAKCLLRSGADKVCINTAAYGDPDLTQKISNYFGAQCVVVGIDAKKNSAGKYTCYSHCGQRDTGIEVDAWAKNMEAKGAGEILITSIDHDGALKGYDLNLIRLVSSSVNLILCLLFLATALIHRPADPYYLYPSIPLLAIAAAFFLTRLLNTPRLNGHAKFIKTLVISKSSLEGSQFPLG